MCNDKATLGQDGTGRDGTGQEAYSYVEVGGRERVGRGEKFMELLPYVLPAHKCQTRIRTEKS
ncbi:hypothetical protein E2C01_079663 [Portunus trituberculatus]|uniref:Uncharacterized protein n=1 Tax=Portunus trituberculatus TaxID=210409 RepID=A0A5B7IK51_PORTR|nr:hypothetical protein [Portunus trituberculatus]